MKVNAKMQRRGIVFDHFGIGPLRLRLHVRAWRPMFHLTWGFRGYFVHGFWLGEY